MEKPLVVEYGIVDRSEKAVTEDGPDNGTKRPSKHLRNIQHIRTMSYRRCSKEDHEEENVKVGAHFLKRMRNQNDLSLVKRSPEFDEHAVTDDVNGESC